MDGVADNACAEKSAWGLMHAMTPICILLVDDHAMFRAGMSTLLTSQIANAQVLHSDSLDDALHAVGETPDVVLLDVLLQGLNGLEGIGLVKRKWPNASVIMLSSDAAPETVRAAMARGATAFVSKAESADAVLAALSRALGNGTLPAATVADTPSLPNLTPRQAEVLDLLCQGLSNKAIGRKLELSENTIRWHVQALLGLLHATNRSQAIFAARRRGLIR